MIDEASHRPSEEDLLAFVQGTLSDDAAAKVRVALEADDKLAADVAFMAGLKSTLQDQAELRAPSTEFGWRRFEAELDRTATPTQGRLASVRFLQYAAAGLACVCILQGVALFGGFGTEPDGFETASASEHEHVLAVSFVPQTTELDMRNLLTNVGAKIIDGPSNTGLYRLAFDSADDVAAAFDVLAEQSLIELVAEQ